jgi:hypothetical protein
VFGRPQFRLGAVIAIAVAAGLVAWLLLRGDGSSSSKPAQVPDAFATTRTELADLAAKVQHPFFWLGPKRGFTYELTQTGSGNIYVRYLPNGVDVGTDKPYLTVATYPFPGAYPAIKKQAAAKGAVTARLASGALAVLDNGYPKSVHIAYPDVNYQVEVFDRTPARAMRLVSSGQLKHLGRLKASPSAAPTPGASGAGPTAASVDELKSLATELGHPIYWAGARPGYTYELTRTTSGNLHPLPPGRREVGDLRARFLTVDIPVGAFAAVTSSAGRRRHHQARARRDRRRRQAYLKSIHYRLSGLTTSRGLRPVPSAVGKPCSGDLGSRSGADRAHLRWLIAFPLVRLLSLGAAARGAGAWTHLPGPLLLPLGSLCWTSRPTSSRARSNAARGPARDRPRDRRPGSPDACGSTGDRAAVAVPAVTPPRSSSPGRRRLPATSRSTTPDVAGASPIG